MVAYCQCRIARHANCGRMQKEEQKCSLVGLQWYGLGLDRAAGSLGLSLQVIIISKKRCNDRVPALLYALTQIG